MTEPGGTILGPPRSTLKKFKSIRKIFPECAVVGVAINPGIFMRKAGGQYPQADEEWGRLIAVDILNNFSSIIEMYIAGCSYVNVAYGKDAGDVLHEGDGRDKMRDLGRNMTFFINGLVTA